MGCISSMSTDTEIIESERNAQLPNYINYQDEPFDFCLKFSQGINLANLKKEIVNVSKPCQNIEMDPIFVINSNLDSNLDTIIYMDSNFNSSLDQSRSSKGILISQRDINRPKKIVSFEQEELQKHECEVIQKNKQKKRRRSVYKK